jgi:hypothetical protein
VSGPGAGIGSGVGGPTGVGGTGGSYTPVPRGPTSRVELKIAWEFPTYTEKVETKEGQTIAKQARKALDAPTAFSALAGDDHRPLLVLRECLKCNGTDDALMTRKQDNERTLLMSRWFHCIKLPPDVLQEDHPFHVLFAAEKPGHLFFARWDGSNRKDLTGQQSRTELWDLMESYLTVDYEKSVDTSLKQLVGLLDRYDRIDSDMALAKDQMDDLIEEGQADSAKMKKLQEKLADLEAKKEKAREEAVALSELKLRQAKPESADSGTRPPAKSG